MAEIVEQITDYDTHVGRFVEQLKDKPMFDALAKSYLDEVQELENALYEIILERLLENAVGAQLTNIGKIVGAPRTTDNDVDYKSQVRAKIAINLSDGTPEDIITVMALIVGHENFHIKEEPGMQLRVVLHEPLVITPSIVVKLLDAADIGGGRLLLNYTTSLVESNKLKFGSTTSIGTKGFSDVSAGHDPAAVGSTTSVIE